MTKKKEIIQLEDIEAKDSDRRKFLMGIAGTVIVSSAVVTSGCSEDDNCDSDVGDLGRADSDPYDPVRYDSNTGNSCDTD